MKMKCLKFGLIFLKVGTSNQKLSNPACDFCINGTKLLFLQFTNPDNIDGMETFLNRTICAKLTTSAGCSKGKNHSGGDKTMDGGGISFKVLM